MATGIYRHQMDLLLRTLLYCDGRGRYGVRYQEKMHANLSTY